MKMKIALITPMLQPYRISFYEKLAFSNPDYDFRVYHGVSKREDGRPNFRGETKFHNKGFPENKRFIGPFKIVYNKGMLTEIKSFDPDLVILQGIAGDISSRMVVNWAYKRQKKIILWTAGWEPGIAKGLMLNFKNALVSSFFRKANLHLTYGSNASKYTLSMGVSPEKVRTCYNGIEIDHLLADEEHILSESKIIREKYNMENFITFIYVGGLIPEKRVDLLLEAFSELRKKHKHIKLMLVGDGPLRDEISGRIRELQDEHIYYLGRIIEGVDPYFAASDCMVLPGIGGLALNQAMFWKKTCIVSEADGTEDDLVIENESGFRFEKDKLESLIAAMERRIQCSPENIRNMSDKAREIIVTKSNVNSMVEVFKTGIADCLQGSY
jgi:glycosyltransferase involved in cell wall biosynthesis